MTKKEAINIITNLIINIGRRNNKYRIIEALSIAVQCLISWDKLKENINMINELYYDTGETKIIVISKDDVIKTIEECCELSVFKYKNKQYKMDVRQEDK